MKTLGKLFRSFTYAFDGLRYSFATQLNMRIHMTAAALVSVLTLLLPLSTAEILLITAAVCAVIICELANTALETVVDMISPNPHPLAKIAKDIAAAAVMVSAFFAAIVGAVIFLPLLIHLFSSGNWHELEVTFPSLLAAFMIMSLAATACVNTGRQGYNTNIGKPSVKQELMKLSHSIIELSALDQQERELVEHAMEARERAYVPYSHFKVGSAVRAADGQLYGGCNIENAAYGSTNCAERSALFHAVSRGAEPGTFRMLAVVGETEEPITPCGACRQVMAELCAPDMPVILANMKGLVVRTTVAELLPGAFTERALHPSNTERQAKR